MKRSTPTISGLAICALLGVIDIISLATLGSGADDGPPVLVTLISAVLGVITLVGARIAWRGGPKWGLVAVIVSRVLSALSALPAFFVDDVPDWVPPVVGIFVVLTVVGVGLSVVALRRREFSAA